MKPAREYMYTVLITSSVDFPPSSADGCEVLYCPAGVNRRLPSGEKVNLRKKDVYVSFAYMFAFFTPRPPYGFGEFSIGRTAGRGIDGAGEQDLRIDGDEPNEERRLCDMGGGFMGRAKDVGVPGMDADGAGEPGARVELSGIVYGLNPKSGGAGLLDEILLPGRSILVTLLCWLRVNWPSLVFKL